MRENKRNMGVGNEMPRNVDSNMKPGDTVNANNSIYYPRKQSMMPVEYRKKSISPLPFMVMLLVLLLATLVGLKLIKEELNGLENIWLKIMSSFDRGGNFKDDPPIIEEGGEEISEKIDDSEETGQEQVKEPGPTPTEKPAERSLARPVKLVFGSDLKKSDRVYTSCNWVWYDNRDHKYEDVLIFNCARGDDIYILYSLECQYSILDIEVASALKENESTYLEFYNYENGELIGQTSALNWTSSKENFQIDIEGIDILEIRLAGEMEEYLNAGYLIVDGHFRN